MEILRGTNKEVTLTKAGVPPDSLYQNCWSLYDTSELELVVSNLPIDASQDEWKLRATEDENKFIIEVPDSQELINNNYRLYVRINNIYLSISFTIINSISSSSPKTFRPLTLGEIETPTLGTIGMTSVEILRPTTWPSGLTEIYLQLRNPVGVGEWVVVGMMLQSSQETMIRINNLATCESFEVRWAGVTNNA